MTNTMKQPTQDEKRNKVQLSDGLDRLKAKLTALTVVINVTDSLDTEERDGFSYLFSDLIQDVESLRHLSQ